jgi:hypothetical protein
MLPLPSTRSSAYFMIRITCPRILKYPNPSKSFHHKVITG